MRCRTLPLLVSALFLSASTAQAQTADATVTGQGTATIKLQPDTLRVQLTQFATGKDLKEALAKLKTRREAARTFLTGQGMAKDAARFGEPEVSQVKSERQRQMEMLVMQRMQQNRGGKAAKPKEPPVTVSANLTADLAFKPGSTEERLLAAQSIQEKIKAADLGGFKELQQLTAADEETQEELQGLIAQMGPDGNAQPGEATFQFVCRVNDAALAKARAEAYQRAKKQAGQLAQAAGAELGPLQRLQSDSLSPNFTDENNLNERLVAAYNPQGRNPAANNEPADADVVEAVSASPSQATYRVSVTAAFALKTAGK